MWTGLWLWSASPAPAALAAPPARNLPAPPLADLPSVDGPRNPDTPGNSPSRPELRQLPDPADLPPSPPVIAEARPSPPPAARASRPQPPRARPTPRPPKAPSLPDGPHASSRPQVDLGGSPFDELRTTPSRSIGGTPVVVPTVRGNAASVGKPNRGRLVRGVQLPEAPELYELRRPDEAYASSHTVRLLISAIASFHARADYPRALSIGSLSKQGGGKLRPHSSHQSGRDVDIRLPVSDLEASTHFVPKSADDIDWDAAWQLVKAMLETGAIEYIFLDRDRQRQLLKRAKRDGATPAQLETWFQYPRPTGTNNGIIRHSPGHGSHIHVRFACGPRELRCESY